MVTYPTVNGFTYSWVSLEIQIRGRVFEAVKEINYEEGVERGEFRGSDSEKIARTRGTHTPTGSLVMYKADFDEFLNMLGDGYMAKVFPITVSYKEGDVSPITTDVLEGCALEKIANSNSEGNDPTEVSMDLNFMRLVRDGKTAFGK